ncbi:ABC transporter, permease protein [Pseudoramibacter alactolyticus ATCC 23263]|jgi:polar amino acid transport system permease protein/polar amino acid transport system substrate-binding protein|uniref:ABC transporter, permease protein n=1 Tax=Pseudoramibacter alactolyticus ATCC 23263 TaxID=887929 RepID=E6MI24_9FIRM|nr:MULTISPECIES: amino acid ABC transporter permease [Pseudoramibacter]EFV01348.1 ABC transporter, permease protein [Pseudoramibacter alactolyticus ATCC 23263]
MEVNVSFTELLAQTFPRLLQGLAVTLESTLLSLVLAAVVGLLFGLLSVSRNKVSRAIARVYVDIIRGTPIIVQAFFIYFGVTSALNMRMEPMTAGVITLTLNAGAYLAEIFRGGIQSVDKGQMEAARSLGLPHGMAMRKVILPQAIRTMIPAIVNQCIITLKDSSILSVIGMAELTQVGKLIIANNLESFRMWLIVGIMYFIIIMILSWVSKRIEKRLQNG